MKKEIKIIIAGGIFYLFLLILVFVISIVDKGGFDWSLLWVAFKSSMIGIFISIIIMGIVYLLFNWINKE